MPPAHGIWTHKMTLLTAYCPSIQYKTPTVMAGWHVTHLAHGNCSMIQGPNQGETVMCKGFGLQVLLAVWTSTAWWLDSMSMTLPP